MGKPKNKNKQARKDKTPVMPRGSHRPGLGRGGRYHSPAYEALDLGSLALLNEGGASRNTKKKDKVKTKVYTDDHNCDVCGDKFNAYRKGIKKVPKTLRKEQYAYCSTECINIAKRGLIET